MGPAPHRPVSSRGSQGDPRHRHPGEGDLDVVAAFGQRLEWYENMGPGAGLFD